MRRPTPAEAALAESGLTVEQVARYLRTSVPRVRRLLRHGGWSDLRAATMAAVLRVPIEYFPPHRTRTRRMSRKLREETP